MAYDPTLDPEEYAAQQAEVAANRPSGRVEPPADDYADAMEQGAIYMNEARDAWNKAVGFQLRAFDAQISLAKASFLQQRALSFYQYAALIKES